MIAFGQCRHSVSDTFHYPGTFMTQDHERRDFPFADQRVKVAVAQSTCFDPDEYLAGWRIRGQCDFSIVSGAFGVLKTAASNSMVRPECL